MPVQNQQEDSKECGVCDWKLIIKNTAVQVKGWLVRGGGCNVGVFTDEANSVV